MTVAIKSWCPGDKCDPCLPVGQVQITGKYQGQNALIMAYSTITNFPEFPIRVSAAINFLGIADPFTNIIYTGAGSVNLAGSSPSLAVIVPLPPTGFSLNAPVGWRPGGGQNFLFQVTAQSATTVGATLDITTVDVLYFATPGAPSAVSVRWIGDVS